MSSFKDIGKCCNDLVEKGFPSNNVWKVEANTAGKDGAAFNFTANRTHSDVVQASASFKMCCKERGLKTNLELKSGNTVKVDATLTDKLVKGLALKVAHDNSNKNVVTSTYKNDWGSVEAVATVPADHKKSEVEVSSVFVKDNYLFGVRNVMRAGDQPAFKSLELAVQFKRDDYIGAVKATVNGDNQAKFCASYIHRVPAHDLRIGARACFDPARESDQVALEVASELKREDNTWKTKLNSKGVAGVSYSTNVGKGTKMTLASEIDTLQLGKGGAAKYGVHLVYNN